MDEIDIKRALRGYVTADAPPFSVTASALVAKGRRRQSWRTGWVSLGSVGMAGVIALVAIAVLTPRSGLSVAGCDQPPPLAEWPLVGPSVEVLTATPTPRTTSAEPTQSPHEEPSSQPTELASELPSSQPTELASDLPSSQPVEATRWPSTAPTGPLPDDPDPIKVAAMACYVRGAAVLLFPNASFAPASEPPLAVVRWSQLDFATGWKPVYNVRAMVVEGERAGMFGVQIHPLPQATQMPAMPEVEVRSLGDGRTAYIDRGSRPMFVQVTTRWSSIVIMCEGLLTADQAIELASAPELDLFR